MYPLSPKDKLDIEQLWRKFLTVKLDDESRILDDFTNFHAEVIFPRWTKKEEVLDFFDRIYPEGVKGLQTIS